MEIRFRTDLVHWDALSLTMAGLTQELEGGLAASFSFFDAAFEGLAFLGWSWFAFDFAFS